MQLKSNKKKKYEKAHLIFLYIYNCSIFNTHPHEPHFLSYKSQPYRHSQSHEYKWLFISQSSKKIILCEVFNWKIIFKLHTASSHHYMTVLMLKWKDSVAVEIEWMIIIMMMKKYSKQNSIFLN